MFGIPVRVPFLIVMLLAAFWVFVLIWWKPELLEQERPTRVYVSILEGLLCGSLWGFLLAQFSNDPLEGLFLSGFFTGAIWFCVVLYSRKRYAQTSLNAPKRKMKPVERLY